MSLPDGVSEISESDYFLKSDEFRVWLKDEKGKVRALWATLFVHVLICISYASTLMSCPVTRRESGCTEFGSR